MDYAFMEARREGAMRNIRNERTMLSFDEVEPVFKALFPDDQPLQRGDLETTAEYQFRLRSTRMIGKEFTFLIDPGVSHLIPFPDIGYYEIASNDLYQKPEFLEEPEPYAFSIACIRRSSQPAWVTNAYGVAAEGHYYCDVALKIAPFDMSNPPWELFWTDDSVNYRFGLFVRSADAEFRRDLKDGKIRVAVRVRLGDLSGLATQWHEPVPNETFDLHAYQDLILPVTLLDAWIVDLDTYTSLVHWHNPNEG